MGGFWELIGDKRVKSHIGQVVSVFVWGALARFGLTGTTGYEKELEAYLAEHTQNVTALLLVLFFVLSIITFIWPILKGVKAYRLAGPLGLIALAVGFAGGYAFLGQVALGIALLLLAVIMWLTGRGKEVRRAVEA